jgi:hypothetical protein
MATTAANVAPTNASDAEFRAWAQFVHDVFANGGWVQTSDSGQINLTTATRPLAANTKVGYEIWRMADTHQSAAPIYLKIAYGSGVAASNVGIWFAVGVGSDGSGNLVDPNDDNRASMLLDKYSQSAPAITSASFSSTTMECFGSAGTDRAVMVLFEADPVLANNGAVSPNPCVWSVLTDDYNSAASNFVRFLSIERGRDATGATVPDFIIITWTGSSGASANMVSHMHARETDPSVPDVAPVQHLGYHVPFSEQGAIDEERTDALLPTTLTATGVIPLRWRVYPAPPGINAIVARHSIFKFDAADGQGCAGMGSGAYISGRTASVAPYGTTRTYRTAAGLRWAGPAAQEEQFSYVWILYE